MNALFFGLHTAVVMELLVPKRLDLGQSADSVVGSLVVCCNQLQCSCLCSHTAAHWAAATRAVRAGLPAPHCSLPSPGREQSASFGSTSERAEPLLCLMHRLPEACGRCGEPAAWELQQGAQAAAGAAGGVLSVRESVLVRLNVHASHVAWLRPLHRSTEWLAGLMRARCSRAEPFRPPVAPHCTCQHCPARNQRAALCARRCQLDRRCLPVIPLATCFHTKSDALAEAYASSLGMVHIATCASGHMATAAAGTGAAGALALDDTARVGTVWVRGACLWPVSAKQEGQPVLEGDSRVPSIGHWHSAEPMMLIER